MREMRGHMAWYTKGMPHSATLRNEINQVETLEGFVELLDRKSNLDNGHIFLYNTQNVWTLRMILK